MAKPEAPAFVFEDMFWEFLDAAKDLLAAERWQGALMDCSKNELLALVHVYRTGESTMSALAEYVGVPLNTATGIANRLERRGLVERWRSEQDKRVVEIRITEQGRTQFADVVKNVGDMVEGLVGDLDADERRVLLGVVGKAPRLLANAAAPERNEGGRKAGMRRIAVE